MKKENQPETNKEEPTPINSRAELDALRAKIVQECGADINAALRKHGCQLMPVAQYVPDGSGAFKLSINVNVVPAQ